MPGCCPTQLRCRHGAGTGGTGGGLAQGLSRPQPATLQAAAPIASSRGGWPGRHRGRACRTPAGDWTRWGRLPHGLASKGGLRTRTAPFPSPTLDQPTYKAPPLHQPGPALPPPARAALPSPPHLHTTMRAVLALLLLSAACMASAYKITLNT